MRRLIVSFTAIAAAAFALTVASDAAQIRHQTRSHGARYSKSWMKTSTCDTPREVGMAGQVVLRIRTQAEFPDCQKRADAINGRLAEMMNQKLRAWDIQVKQNGIEWAVYADRDLVITADTDSARLNGCSSRELANIWAANLKSVVQQVVPYHNSAQADRYKARMEREGRRRR